jgi:hypothetical protein
MFMNFIAAHGNINFAARNMILDQVKLNMENTQVANGIDSGAFDFKVRNLGLNFQFKYDVFSEQLPMQDTGMGRAIFDDIMINLDFSLFLNNKKIEANVDTVNISVSELNLLLQGGDFSHFLNQFISQLRGFLEDKIHEQL